MTSWRPRTVSISTIRPSDAERLGITTHVTVIDGGKAAQAIVQAGERFVVDAIVVGSHGKGRALRSLLGSVSRDVVHQARIPVLVVPSPGAAAKAMATPNRAAGSGDHRLAGKAELNRSKVC